MNDAEVVEEMSIEEFMVVFTFTNVQKRFRIGGEFPSHDAFPFFKAHSKARFCSHTFPSPPCHGETSPTFFRSSRWIIAPPWRRRHVHSSRQLNPTGPSRATLAMPRFVLTLLPKRMLPKKKKNMLPDMDPLLHNNSTCLFSPIA